MHDRKKRSRELSKEDHGTMGCELSACRGMRGGRQPPCQINFLTVAASTSPAFCVPCSVFFGGECKTTRSVLRVQVVACDHCRLAVVQVCKYASMQDHNKWSG